MAEPTPESAAQGTLNATRGSKVAAPYESTEAYFRPQTGEIIFVPAEDAGAFEAHGLAMSRIIDLFHKANIAVSNAIEEYGRARSSPDPAIRSAAERDYQAAIRKQKKAQADVKSVMPNIEALGKLSPGASSIVELIPLSKNKANGNSRQNRRFVYVKSGKLKSGWRAYRVKRSGTDANDGENILLKGGKIDTEKLKKQLTDLKHEVKAELWKEEYFSGVLDVAKELNESLKWEPTEFQEKYGKYVDLGAQAQLMRYLGGASAEGSWDPKNGKAGLKAEAKAEFSVAEGKFKMALYAPNRLGWVLQFTSAATGKTYPLGAIRGQLEFVAAGVCGASLIAELSAEIECTALKLVVKGAPAPQTPPTVDPNAGPNLVADKVKVAPVKLEVGGFAGVKADVDLAGSLQWLNPEKKDNDFQDFVKLAPGGSAMLGVGLSGKLQVSYADGKFKLVVEASLCIGAGARGKLACETDAKVIMAFVYWFFYQLYNANYEFLAFVTNTAFGVLKNLQFLAIQSGKDISEFVGKTREGIGDDLDEVIVMLEKSGGRNTLAAKILSNPVMLRISTPETKGMLLYQLTRHGNVDWVDPGNVQAFDLFTDRKKAVLKVLQFVQTTREWDNVFQHMDPYGAKTNGSNYLTVKRFLELGWEDMDDDLDSIKRRLKSEPAPGYPVVANNTPAYRVHEGEHSQFARAELNDLARIDLSHLG